LKRSRRGGVRYSAAERQEHRLAGAGVNIWAVVGPCHVDHSLLQKNIAPAERRDAVVGDGRKDLLPMVLRRPRGAHIRLGVDDSLSRPPSENKLARRTSLGVGQRKCSLSVTEENSPGVVNVCKCKCAKSLIDIFLAAYCHHFAPAQKFQLQDVCLLYISKQDARPNKGLGRKF